MYYLVERLEVPVNWQLLRGERGKIRKGNQRQKCELEMRVGNIFVLIINVQFIAFLGGD